MSALEQAIRNICKQLGENPAWCITLDETGVEPDLAEAIRRHIGPIFGETADPKWVERRRLELQGVIDAAQAELNALTLPDEVNDTPVTQWLVRGNVTEQGGIKAVVRADRPLHFDERFVCDSPHADGDFSYLCYFEHCRCRQ